MLVGLIPVDLTLMQTILAGRQRKSNVAHPEDSEPGYDGRMRRVLRNVTAQSCCIHKPMAAVVVCPR